MTDEKNGHPAYDPYPFENQSDGLEIRHSVDPWGDFLYVAGRLQLSTARLEQIEKLDLLPGMKGKPRTFHMGRGEESRWHVIDFEPGTDEDHALRILTELARVDDVEPSSLEGIAPDHVLTTSGHANFYPARPVFAAQNPPQSLPDQAITTDCSVGIIDVGFIDFGRNNVRSNLPIDYVVAPDPLTPDVGHGEWVAWIVDREAPGRQITGHSIQPVIGANAAQHGLITSTSIANGLAQLIYGARAKIITLTAGGPVGNGPQMYGVRLALAGAEAEGVLVVSASGNRPFGNRPAVPTHGQPIYPAAYTTVLAVGASEYDAANGRWEPATYTNFFPAAVDPGVDVCARGEHDVPFIDAARYVPQQPGQPYAWENFNGVAARIAGTSFAVPVVAGAVAARCDEYLPKVGSGAPPREAALDVLNTTQTPVSPDFLFGCQP